MKIKRVLLPRATIEAMQTKYKIGQLVYILADEITVKRVEGIRITLHENNIQKVEYEIAANNWWKEEDLYFSAEEVAQNITKVLLDKWYTKKDKNDC